MDQLDRNPWKLFCKPPLLALKKKKKKVISKHKQSQFFLSFKESPKKSLDHLVNPKIADIGNSLLPTP